MNTDSHRALDSLQPGELQYLPGLRTDPEGALGTWLRDRFGGRPIDLAPHAMREASDAARARGRPLRRPLPSAARLFEEPLARVRAALRTGPPPRLVVSRSFGSAVLLELACRGELQAPNVMIAGAANQLTEHDRIPPSCPTVLLHGIDDEVVPLHRAEQLARASGDHVELRTCEGGHQLPAITDDGTLEAAMADVFSARA